MGASDFFDADAKVKRKRRRGPRVSNEDSFIDEVSEEVSRDRLFGLMRRYGWIAIVAVVALVGGAGWSEYTKARDRVAAEALGDAVLSALETDEPADAAAALGAIEAAGPATAVAGFLEASELLDSGDIEGAVGVFDRIAQSQDVPQIYRDLAFLKSLMAQSETLDVAERRAGFETLAGAGQAFRILASEQIAMIDVETGDIDAAISKFQTLLQDAESTEGLRRRARGMIVALGAEPEELAGATLGQ